MDAIETKGETETADSNPLDQILGSRSHVRVLRALIIKDPGENLGLRDVARMAGVSHSRTLKVLRELQPTGVILGHKTRWGTIYELNSEHFLAPQLWTLFDDELHILVSIEGYLRGEAMKTRRTVRMQVKPGIGTDLDVVVTGSRPFSWEDQAWFRELETAIERRFGVVARIAPRDPGEWLLRR